MTNQGITSADSRKKISIELCENLIFRLNPVQSRETILGALIAVRNLILGSKIQDPILDNILVDTITHPDPLVRNYVKKIISAVNNNHLKELLEMKLSDENISVELKEEIRSFLTKSVI